MMAISRGVSIDEVAAYFQGLEDPRSSINRRHPLVAVVVIAVLGVLAGASGPTAIADWAAIKEKLLVEALGLEAGVPCKDVFRRVLMALNPAAFQECFAAWLGSLRAAAAGVDQPILAVDGKTLRRSHDRRKGLGALHSVSVWASEFGLTLGQVACAEKSNEITAIPELLRLVDVKRAIITIDAMGTQKAIAAEIVRSKADYVLALKGNQETFHQAVVAHIAERLEEDDAGTAELVVRETGHGREEERTYLQRPVPDDLPGKSQWKGLKSVGMATSRCMRNGKESVAVRYYISSLRVDVERFARAVRSHWSIENSCHWTLDVTYREDESRIREKALRENFAWLNRLTLSLLKQHPGKGSIAKKRRACGWSNKFLMEVLTGITT
jgi:predicted transposase YbfD/YdcC